MERPEQVRRGAVDIDGRSDDIWSSSQFGALLSKDAVVWLATDPKMSKLVRYIECDQVIGGG
jgi:hypothetical protein